MELSAHVWKLGAACAHEQENMKHTKATGLYALNWWFGIKDLEIYIFYGFYRVSLVFQRVPEL